MMSSSFTLSSSSTLVPSPIPNRLYPTRTSLGRHPRVTAVRVGGPLTTTAVAVAAASSSSPVASPRKRHWKEGEYPGSPSSQVSDSHYHNKKKERTPIKNVKKKPDKKKSAKSAVDNVNVNLSDCIAKKQWQKALQVFARLKKQSFYQPKEDIYMRLLVLLGRCGQPGQAQQLFDSLIQEGLEPTSELYTALIGAFCRSNLLDKAFAVLHRMVEIPHCQPDVNTYSVLIKACVDAGQFDVVESLYEQMTSRSIVPNTVTQNVVLSGYGRAGRYAEMERVLIGMIESTNSKPDVWTMNTILSLFGNTGQIEIMERWFEKFRNFGIEPETPTFNILIGAYGKRRMYDKMSSVMDYMRKHSFPWTTSTYNKVIEVFSDAGDAKHMQYTFDQMRNEGMKADTKTFCCLIRGYANAGLFHKVISTVQLAGTLEIPENTSFFNSVIYACAKAEDLMEMERVFKRMKDKQCQPDVMTYSTMADAYNKEGMTDKVYDLEQEKQAMTAIQSNDNHNDEDKLS